MLDKELFLCSNYEKPFHNMKLKLLDKSIKIIDLMCENPQGMSLGELNAGLGFPKSTIHHILNTFLPHNYVAQDPESKKYCLGPRFLTLSKVLLDNIDVKKIARKHLSRLHEKCNETVHLAILMNGQVVYIDKIEKPARLSLATYIGFSTDAHAAAGGKVLLCELPPEEISNIYQDRPLKTYGKKTIVNFHKLKTELNKIKKQGYAIDDEEYYEGVRCVAAPIRAGGKIVAAVSITGPAFAITMQRLKDELRELVVKTAEEISSEMQW